MSRGPVGPDYSHAGLTNPGAGRPEGDHFVVQAGDAEALRQGVAVRAEEAESRDVKQHRTWRPVDIRNEKEIRADADVKMTRLLMGKNPLT